MFSDNWSSWLTQTFLQFVSTLNQLRPTKLNLLNATCVFLNTVRITHNFVTYIPNSYTRMKHRYKSWPLIIIKCLFSLNVLQGP